MPGIQVDGNDILAVYSAAKEAIDRARSGGGPSLIENVTYRMMMHTTADDPKRYRKDEEVEVWRKRDPIQRFQKYLKNKGLLSDQKIEELEAQIKEEIQKAVEHAEELMKKHIDPLHMFEQTYAEMPPHLKEQQEELKQELAEMPREEDHG
jgi:pyruvate dehydrogenase E1 component alpha subunit